MCFPLAEPAEQDPVGDLHLPPPCGQQTLEGKEGSVGLPTPRFPPRANLPLMAPAQLMLLPRVAPHVPGQ